MMDPWMEYQSSAAAVAQQAYHQASHLRVPGTASQVNHAASASASASLTHQSHHPQYPQNGVSHSLHHHHQLPAHMAAYNAVPSVTCQKPSVPSQVKNPKTPTGGGGQQTVHHQMPPTVGSHVPSHPSTGQSPLMNGHHYGGHTANGHSPWFFNSRQQTGAHDSSLQVRNHPERGNPNASSSSVATTPSSFNGANNPFGNYPHHPHHHHPPPQHASVYDSTFMSGHPFQQQSKPSTYLPTMAAASAPGAPFMSNMSNASKKLPDTEIENSFRSSAAAAAAAAAYYQPMKGIHNMSSMTQHCNSAPRDPTSGASSYFNGHSLGSATSAWHQHHQHQMNLVPPSPGPSRNVSMLPASHEPANRIPTAASSSNAASASSSSTILRHAYNRGQATAAVASANPVPPTAPIGAINGLYSAKGASVNSTNAKSVVQNGLPSSANVVGSHSQMGSQYKATPMAPARPNYGAMPTAAEALSASNNSYLMSNFASASSNVVSSRTGHHHHSNGYPAVDPTSLGAKFAAAAVHQAQQAASDYATSFALAAAAMNSEYASFQQQAQKQHQQYMSSMTSMNNFAAANATGHPHHHGNSANMGHTSATGGGGHDYHSMAPFDTSANYTNASRHSNSLMGYHCPTALFPMSGGHSAESPSLTGNYKSHHSSCVDDYSQYAHTGNGVGPSTNQQLLQQQQQLQQHHSISSNVQTQTNTAPVSKSTTRKSGSTAKRNYKSTGANANVGATAVAQSVSLNNAASAVVYSAHEYAPSPVNCNGTMMNSAAGSGASVCMPSNVQSSRSSVSRCSSVASNHPMQLQQPQQQTQQQQQQHSADSYSYPQYSPATTNMSAHSPYSQQRSSTSNSSHSSGASQCTLSNGAGTGDYLNYGTPNPQQQQQQQQQPATVFSSSMGGTSVTPTPTPGYPTPPSSVGHSNSRCNSNEELSPYSSNSMSSSISGSYPRNDSATFKSSASSSSGISPKQLDGSMSDGGGGGLQFASSCMVASQKTDPMGGQSKAQQQQHCLAPSMFESASNPMDDSYKTQQYSAYPGHLSSSAPASTLSNDLYMSYSSAESANALAVMSQQQQQQQQHQEAMVDSGVEDVQMDSSNYEYQHYETQTQQQQQQPTSGPFDDGSGYSEKDQQLPSCAQVAKVPTTAASARVIDPLESEHIQHHQQQQHHHHHEPESFNLNFDSVIQPIEVNHLTGGEETPELAPPTSHQADQSMEMTMGDDKSPFATIDELTFIASQAACVPTETTHCTMAGGEGTVNSSGNVLEHCTGMDSFTSSHGPSGHLLDHHDTSSLEEEEEEEEVCPNLQSIIDSLPKSTGSSTADDCDSLAVTPAGKGSSNDGGQDASHLMAGSCGSSSTVEDSFLSDLAPLMNDNSKIALMESTFKSNDHLAPSSLEADDKDLGVAFAKLNQELLFSSHDLKPTKHESPLGGSPVMTIDFFKGDCEVTSRLKDVDDFLESNLKDVPQPHQQQQSEEQLPAKNSIDAIIERVARAGPTLDSPMDCDEQPQEETKASSFKSTASNKSSASKKTAESKKKQQKQQPPSETVTESKDKSVQSKFFKRKAGDSSPLGGSNANKKRKVAVVMPKSKELTIKKAPSPPRLTLTSTSEYDFFDIATSVGGKPKKPSNSTKKGTMITSQLSPPLSSTGTTTITTPTMKLTLVVTEPKPVVSNSKKAPSKMQSTKKEPSSAAPHVLKAKEKTVQCKATGTVQSKAVKPTKAKSVAEIAPTSCSVEATVESVATSLVVCTPKKPVAASLSPNSLSDVKENVASLNTSTSCRPAPTVTTATTTTVSERKKKSTSASSKTTASQVQTNSLKSEKTPTPSTVNSRERKKASKTSTSAKGKTVTSTSTTTTGTGTTPKSATLPIPVAPKPPPTSSFTTTLSNNTSNRAISSSSSSSLLVSPKTTSPTVVSTATSTLRPSPPIAPPQQQTGLLASSGNFTLNRAHSSGGAPGTTTLSTPTLIVNPIESSQSVNSYGVSPVTNAVLISIHPANTTGSLHSSLNGSSTFITLNTQNVTSAGNGGNCTTTASACCTQTSSSSSSRRRSADKKVATTREGLMRTGDFVVSEEEAALPLPVIWRIEGKSLLQRFEPSEQNGLTVYTNTSSYSAWNPTVRQKYLGLDVRIMGCNRTRIVVEKIGLTNVAAKTSERSLASVCEKEPSTATAETASPEDISHHLESFEVLIQTLISQALDSNFIAEIIKEKDEYFLRHMAAIDSLCNRRRSRFVSIVKWDTSIIRFIEMYPDIQQHEQNDVGDLRCRLCHDNWSTKILFFEGIQYKADTLEPLETQAEVKQTKLASCESCTERTFLYSRVHHQKYKLYLECKDKVNGIYALDESKESHVVLEECLQDGAWVKKLFSNLEASLLACDNLR